MRLNPNNLLTSRIGRALILLFCSITLCSCPTPRPGPIISPSGEYSKKSNAFLFEYDVYPKHIVYRDSMRDIDFTIKEAFAEYFYTRTIKEQYGHTINALLHALFHNYTIYPEEEKKINIVFEDYRNQVERGLYDVWEFEGHSDGAGSVLCFSYDSIPPDTVKIKLLSYSYDENRKPLPDNNILLTEILLIRKE